MPCAPRSWWQTLRATSKGRRTFFRPPPPGTRGNRRKSRGQNQSRPPKTPHPAGCLQPTRSVFRYSPLPTPLLPASRKSSAQSPWVMLRRPARLWKRGFSSVPDTWRPRCRRCRTDGAPGKDPRPRSENRAPAHIPAPVASKSFCRCRICR